MASRLRGYWITLLAAVAICGAMPGYAQNANPPSPHRLDQSPGQVSVAQEPSGVAKEWLTVPVGRIVPGAANVRPNIENPKANDPSSVQRGMLYFIQFNCVGCHAANGGGGMGPALSNRFFKFGAEPANIYLTIAHGRPLGMPSWGALLPDDVIWDLVSYIGSISNAPQGSWGTTVSANSPDIEQVPAEFQHTATPWQFTQPFSNGQKPSEHPPTGRPQ